MGSCIATHRNKRVERPVSCFCPSIQEGWIPLAFPRSESAAVAVAEVYLFPCAGALRAVAVWPPHVS